MVDRFKGNLLLTNGNFQTMDPLRPNAEAVLIRGGKIERVGALRDVREWSRGAEEFDCLGRTVLPGFVDGHCHFEMTCVTMDSWISVHTPPHRSLHEVAETIRSEIDLRQPKDWILCRSSFSMQEKVSEGRLFTREELDAICSNRPLAVFASIHVASMNTLAFKRLGLWEPDSQHPHHGVIHRTADGVPSGVATEVFLMVPTPDSEDEFTRSVIAHAHDMFNAAGTTTVHTLPESLKQVDIQRTLHERSHLTLRQRYYLITPGVATLDEAIRLSKRDTDDEMFTFGGIKLFVNGCAHDGMGHELNDVKWSQDALNAFVAKAHSERMQVWLHSLNSEGVRMAALAILNATSHDPASMRHRIEHGADYIDLDDLSLVAESGALLVTTPQFLHSMGDTLAKKHAPLRTLIDFGFRPIGATDSTGTVPASVSVLGNVSTSMTRLNGSGTVVSEDERIDAQSALRMFTTWSSEGAFEECMKGMIREGYMGDLTILSDDPMQADPRSVADIVVEKTFLGGELVYSRDAALPIDEERLQDDRGPEGA